MADEVLNSMAAVGKGLGDMFINLSAEYPAILHGVILVFGAAGVFIAGTAAFEVMKMGRKDSMSYNPAGASAWKMFGGASLVDLAFWAGVWADTLWSMSDDMDMAAYSAQSGQDYTQAAIMAAIGFIVIAGYVVLGRAYMGITKLGYLSPEARSDLISASISRIVAGSLMIASMHISQVLNESTGFNWMPT